ncbi:MAG: alpha-1,2-fucosyltransferase [Methylocystis sp.]
MLSFNSLGKMGRLGNQMFQYAAIFAVARRRGFDFMIPPSSAEDLWVDHQLFAAFELPGARYAGFSQGFSQAQAAGFEYDPVFAETCPDNSDLHGYFQSEAYFSDAADAVRREFAFRRTTTAEAESLLRAVAGEKISLHVRRGDYLAHADRHPPCDPDYYARALKRLPPELPVVVFSDDIAWCRDHPPFRSDRFVLKQSASNIVDLCAMRLCDHHIIRTAASVGGAPGSAASRTRL